jgi:hypothetical protein
MLVKGDAVGRLTQQLCKGLFPLLYRHPPQVAAIDLEQVEGAQDQLVTAQTPHQVEHR